MFWLNRRIHTYLEITMYSIGIHLKIKASWMQLLHTDTIIKALTVGGGKKVRCIRIITK